MTQISLLNSTRLSGLLTDALSWNDKASSLLVSATNGSILASAFRSAAPAIKAMRTQSTTMTAAYTAASESTLVFESQDSGAVSVITSVADHVVLAITGAATKQKSSGQPHLHSAQQSLDKDKDVASDKESITSGDSDEDEANQESIRQDLESLGQELAEVLRRELAGMKWPDDI